MNPFLDKMAETPTCPYAVLNIPRDASEDEIKKAYRRLAIQHHPDKNQGSVESTQMFQKISASYAILSDPEKRERYDRTGSLNEEDMEEPDMDDLMEMFFTQFGGGGFMFGGSPMFFEFGGPGFGGSRGGRSYMDPFAGFGGFADWDEFGSEFGDSYDDYDMFMDEFMEVIPALFCSHFIEIEEVAAATSSTSSRSKKKQPTEKFKCTICQTVMKSPEAAENHFMHAHPILVEKFCKVLEREGMEGDIEALFANFATDVKSGKVKETRTKPKKNRARRRRNGPKIASHTRI